MADIIQLRRDTLERWSEFNPTLAEGEVGFVLGSYQYKVGDGVHAWNDLPLSFNGNIVDLFTNNENEGYDSVISQGGLSTIFKYIVSNGSHIDISSSWTTLDEFNTIDKCGFYVLMRGKTPCYHMIITADSMAHGVYQWIFGNLSIDDDGQIRGGHWDGRAHILFRYINRGQSTWSNWKYLQNDFISNDGETNQQIPDTAYAPSLNYFKKVVDEIQTAITANTENIAEVREAMITDISVNGDAEGVNITQENTLTHAGIAMKIPNADARSNKAGVVTSAEINALYEIDFAAADVTNIGFDKDAEKNKITLTGIGQFGDYHSSEIELTPATSELAGLMSTADKTKVDNYPEQFVLDLGIVESQAYGEREAAKSEVAGNRNISFIRFQVRGVKELKTTLIMQWPNGIHETAQIMCVDKQQWRRNVTGATGVAGAPTNAYNWERTAPHSIGYDEQSRIIQLKDYQNEIVSQGVELPLAMSSKPGLMSSADKIKLDRLAIDTPWEGHHMNAFTETGEYHIHGERTDANDGLPILNAASGHTIDARLTVLDSSLTNGTGAKTDICVTQFLRLSNRTGGDGHVYVRTAQAASKAELTATDNTKWSTWEKLMGMFEKNAVTNIADLDTYTTNGMYSGLFANTTLQSLGGLQFAPGDTFLMVTVNGYAASAFGTPQLTQMLYRLPAKTGSEQFTAKMYIRTAWWDARAKVWVWANWDRLATASEISGEYNRLNELISANTEKISSVESTANDAKSAAETAKTAADTAQTAAETAQNAATEAKTAAQEAKNTAETAQATATAAKEKNAAQDARLDNIEARIDPDIAGRVWNEDNGTPKAESYYGSVKALRDLPKRLGLGRYLVKDDRTRRKLDPNDSHKYLDGTPAALDGTEGQCMWCWNGFYANIWHEGSRLIKAVTFDGPVGNDISIWIPAGGISWLGAGVIDRGEAPYTDKTKWKLCSVINNSEQFRGGGGTALDASKYSKSPADTTPQITMLGMPATLMSTTQFGEAARKRRGEGWEANWFVARFVVEFLFEIIMGTENSQEGFNNLKDANGLYQGGFGTGVTDMPDWGNYNGSYPVIPTSIGLEAGDGVCLVEYKLPDASGGTYHTFNVPVFFGLVGAGYGNLCQWVRGLIIDAGEKSLVYVTPSMYADYDPSIVTEKIMVAECPRVSGYIKRKSYKGLCCMPTELGGSTKIRYSDYFSIDAGPLRVRAAGGDAIKGENAGESFSFTNSMATRWYTFYTSPLCYFTEDPIIPDSHSIANNH